MRLSWRVIKIIFWCFFVIAVSVWAVIEVQIDRGAARLGVEKRLLQQEGIPITPEEIQRPSPAPALDAAPEYVELTALLKAKPIPKKVDSFISSLGHTHGVSTAEEDAAAKRLLGQRPDVMDLVHQAASKPECVFRREWSRGPDMPLPEYASIREGARLLRAESYLLAKEGRFREAINNQALGFRLAEHAGMDPCLIGYLVDIACDSIALSGLEDILNLAGPNATVAEQVWATIAAHHPAIDLFRAMQGEVIMDIGVAQLLRQPKPGQPHPSSASPAEDTSSPLSAFRELGSGSSNRSIFGKKVIDAMLADVLHNQHSLLEVSRLPEKQRLAAFKKTTAEIRQKLSSPLGKYNPSTILSSILMPVYDQAASKEYYAHARERVVMAGAAVLAYRARRGTFPSSLQEAIPQPLLDPFTGQPLLYRREGNGFVVYSAGEEGKFDGGQPGMKRQGGEAYFRYLTYFP